MGSFVACSAHDGGKPVDAATALEDMTGTRWIVDGEPPTFALPEQAVPLPGGESTTARVLAFLDRAKHALKLADPWTEYRLREEVRSPDGAVHVRLQQVLDGVEIESHTWTVHLRADRVVAMGGSHVRLPSRGSVAEIDRDRASRVVRHEFGRERAAREADIVSSTPRLTYEPFDGALRLVWGASVYSSADAEPSRSYRVDALTGSVIASWSNAASATAVGYGSKHYPPFDEFANNDQLPRVSFPVSSDKLPSSMQGPLRIELAGRDVEIVTKDAKGCETEVCLAGAPIEPVSATGMSPWSDAIVPKGIAVDMQWNATRVVQFYASLQRNGAPFLSYDGQGSPLVGIVNVDTPIARSNGAYWDPHRAAMFLSGGNPSGKATDGFYPVTASLETIVHEVTHGVSGATWLQAPPREGAESLETFAINESVSDIFAALVAHEAGADDGSAFLFSEDDNALRLPWRSLVYPKQRSLIEPDGPVHCDHVVELTEGRCEREAHRAAGIPNHAFYLMTHGGLSAHESVDSSGAWRVRVPCGIGWEAAKRLYWDLVSSRMDAAESFRRMALDSIAAGRDLGVGIEPIVCAWAAVGVLSVDEASRVWGVSCEKVASGSATSLPPDLEATKAQGTVLVVPGHRLLACESVKLARDAGREGGGLLTH